ncbi:MAG: helix-turn-helix transcriptional regulator [Bosea sp. (in: a-proteobacteria)]
MTMKTSDIFRPEHTACNSKLAEARAASLSQTADRSFHGKEAARFLGLSHKTLNNWRVQGIGPRFVKAHGARGSVRYPLSELIAWRDAHLKSSTSQGEG